MFKPERLQAIYEIIKSNGQATVTTLADRTGVSEMTIRRDLQELEADGLVQRVHGGAIPADVQRQAIEPPIRMRQSEQEAEKLQLALAIVNTISPDETIFLGSGTTTLAVAEVLAASDLPVTVITNALTIANALSKTSHVGVVVVGGYLRRSELSLVGHITERMLSELRVSKAIVGIRGIDPEHGLTSDDFQELKTDQSIFTISDTVIIVADHTKFGRVAANRVAPIEAASKIVTSNRTSAAILDAIRSHGVEVIQIKLRNAS